MRVKYTPAPTQPVPRTRLSMIMDKVWCLLHGGHDSVLHFEGKRVMMRCTSCGHDSPGWNTDGRGPRQKFEGDARRHVMVPQKLVFRKTA